MYGQTPSRWTSHLGPWLGSPLVNGKRPSRLGPSHVTSYQYEEPSSSYSKWFISLLVSIKSVYTISAIGSNHHGWRPRPIMWFPSSGITSSLEKIINIKKATTRDLCKRWFYFVPLCTWRCHEEVLIRNPRLAKLPETRYTNNSTKKLWDGLYIIECRNSVQWMHLTWILQIHYKGRSEIRRSKPSLWFWSWVNL